MATSTSAATSLNGDIVKPKVDERRADTVGKLLERLELHDDGSHEAMRTLENIGNKAKEAAAKRMEDPLKHWTPPHRGDCPICLLPLPIREKEVTYRSCCDSTICKGCIFDHLITLMKDGVDRDKVLKAVGTCPLCRGDPAHSSAKEMLKLQKKLAKAGRHEAMYELAMTYIRGENGVNIDWDEGLNWMQRAAEEGFGRASHFLGECYLNGNGKGIDLDQAILHLKAGGEGGSVTAFGAVAELLMDIGEIEEAMLNYRKAAMCGVGDGDLFASLRNGYREGFITKDEYMVTLRGHQKVSNEMKSEARTRALRLV